MKVILADCLGFCFGVEKAINTVFKKIHSMNNNLYSLGPLIHNRQVVSKLEEMGLKEIKSIDEVTTGSVIIRSHGVPAEVYSIAEEKGLNLIDTTCPYVKRIQELVNSHHNEGYKIIIVGNHKHPEVIGINGWCENTATIIHSVEEAEKLPFSNMLCVVVQTTMSLSLFEKIIQPLEKKGENVKIFNTICSATKERQDAARKLASQVDAIIVVGGKHSSNTQKLMDICKEIRPNTTIHVETAEDIDPYLLRGYEKVGITAGASTPGWIIEDIINKINVLN